MISAMDPANGAVWGLDKTLSALRAKLMLWITLRWTNIPNADRIIFAVFILSTDTPNAMSIG